MADYCKLYTEEGEALSGTPWNVYPRPQMRRDSFLCLNGEWDFAVCPEEQTPVYDRKIRVPFAPESLLSGIGEVFGESDVLWYRRLFRCPAVPACAHVLLHIGAADQEAAVLVNGNPVGMHSGGYEAFVVDITDALRADGGENELVIGVTDHLSDGVMPYGKQRRDRGGMWYTPVSGIWQTVWLEIVPAEYIRRLKIDAAADSVVIRAEGVSEGSVAVQTPDGILRAPLTRGEARVTVPGARLWSPEDPYLYTFTVETAEDRVESYFALRTLEIREVNGMQRLCLNGRPYFFHGLLDQGYWSDGLFTPASPRMYEKDILAMKALGFNTLRKHIKIEPEQFYYDCDRLGMIVWQDMVNNGSYSFVRDTALPTVGLRRIRDKHIHRHRETRRQFLLGMKSAVRQLYNHPSVCLWTIFNEGWGQFCSTFLYRRLREMDAGRFIDTASGWFSGGETDVDSRHVYFRRVDLKARKKPLILSEFGGYSFSPEGHVYNTEKTYGYGKYEDRAAFAQALRRLYIEQILPQIPRGLCAAIYTQVSDVEDETNGLLSYDRRVQKILPQELADVSAQLCKTIREE